MKRVGVTGGIGSGKSTVCALFAQLGVPVYDSDRRARELVNDRSGGGNEAGNLREAISELLGQEAYRDGMLDRAYVAGRVFGDRMLLSSLNGIVHPAVARDFESWILGHADAPYVVMESAILFESGFDRFMNHTIAVCAPEDLRVERVVARRPDGDYPAMSREEVLQRMTNQMSDDERRRRADRTIDNNGTRDKLAARVTELDKLLRQ